MLDVVRRSADATRGSLGWRRPYRTSMLYGTGWTGRRGMREMQAPYFQDERTTLYHGSVLDVLPTLADSSVACVVTSPPYYGLRDYGTGRWEGGDPTCAHRLGGRGGGDRSDRRRRSVARPEAAHRGAGTVCVRCGAIRVDEQFGLEPSPAAYVENLRSVFAHVHRVLHPHGVVWLNLGDTYNTRAVARDSSHQPGFNPGRSDHTTIGRSWSHNAGIGGVRMPSRGLPEKNLLGIPWRVAFALQADGWWLRNAITWHKPNAMPESVRDRLSTRHETVFLLTRSPRYWFDLDAIRQPHAPISLKRAQPHRSPPGRAMREGLPYHGIAGIGTPQTLRLDQMNHPAGRNPGDVWSIPTTPSRGTHFATFPQELARRCILAGCPADEVVLDPFAGSGTTLLVAKELGRRGIGIDLNRDYVDLTRQRLAARPPQPPPSAARRSHD